MKTFTILCLLLFTLQQTASSGEPQRNEEAQVFEGCVMTLESNHDFLTLCEASNCSLLRGTVEKTWAGHSVKLQGSLRKPSSTQPRTIDVKKALEVGKACDKICQPAVPGRGLVHKNKPGGEGGTPGATSNPLPPPNN